MYQLGLFVNMNSSIVSNGVQRWRVAVPRRYSLKSAKVLKRGVFGQVYRVLDTVDMKHVVIECISCGVEDFRRQIKILKHVKLLRLLSGHPNVLKLVEINQDPFRKRLFLVTERTGGNVNDAMLAKQFHADLLLKSVAQQLLEVVRAIHDIGLVHTAIRPSAILLQSSGQLRLTGFHSAALAGTARRAGEAGDMPDRWHTAPEALLSSSYPYAASMDMYSVGCVLAEILLQRQLFGGVTFAEHIASMFRLQGYNGVQELGFELDTYAASIIQERCIFPPRNLATTFPNVGLQLCDLLSQLLTVNPAERITAEQALQHPFFITMPTRYPAARRTQLAPPPADVFAFEEEPGAVDSAQLQQLIGEEAKGYATEPHDVYDPLYLPLTCR